jgi:hypothetical protein
MIMTRAEMEGIEFTKDQMDLLERAMFFSDIIDKNNMVSVISNNKNANYDLKVEYFPKFVKSRYYGDKGEREAARFYSGEIDVDRTTITSEIKYDAGLYERSGNMFIEIFMDGTASGMSISKADVYEYILGGERTFEESVRIVFPKHKIRWWLYINFFGHRLDRGRRNPELRIARGGDNNESFGILVPIRMIEQIAKVRMPENWRNDEKQRKKISDKWNIDGEVLRDFCNLVTDKDLKRWEKKNAEKKMIGTVTT